MRIEMNAQRGVALIFALLLLMVMTIIGLAAMSGSSMQERMSGNVNLQSIAFEAASAGISDALDYGIAQRDLQGGCARRADNVPWSVDYEDFTPIELDPMESAVHGLTVQYRLRADCLEDDDLEDIMEGNVPVQWFVSAEGSVWSGGERLSVREIQVRIDDFRTDGLSGLRVEGKADLTFNAANSTNFSMDGHGGPAISAATGENAGVIVEAIEDNDRMSNYTGGVGVSPYPPPFDRADTIAEFVLRTKAYIQYMQDRGLSPDCDVPVFVHNNMSSNGPVPNGIHYVRGNLDFGGNAEGEGLFIVEGNVRWNGRAEVDGLLIALGGSYEMYGGGNGLTEGMLYVANVDLDSLQSDYDAIMADTALDTWHTDDSPGNACEVSSSEVHTCGVRHQIARSIDYGSLYGSPTCDDSPDDPNCSDGFGPASIHFGGGGGHAINYDCALFDAQRQALASCRDDSGVQVALLDEPWEDAGCNIPGQGGSIQAIRSWREDWSGRSG